MAQSSAVLSSVREIFGASSSRGPISEALTSEALISGARASASQRLMELISEALGLRGHVSMALMDASESKLQWTPNLCALRSSSRRMMNSPLPVLISHNRGV